VASSTTISSSRNPLVRQAIRLRDNRYRQRERLVIVDGYREIERALASGLQLQTLFAAETDAHRPVAAETHPTHDDQHEDDVRSMRLIHQSGSAVIAVTPDLLSQIAYGGNPRQAVAIFQRPEHRTFDALRLPTNPLIMVMVGIEKPGNAGAIFRSADAMGADAVILCDTKCDLFNPNLIRGSLGTVFSMPCVEATEPETIAWLRQSGLNCLAAIVGARETMWQADYRGPTAVIVGSEAHGLGPAWAQTHCPTSKTDDAGGPTLAKWAAVSIPMLGIADSLNVSVTAAALLFEARRQRLCAHA